MFCLGLLQAGISSVNIMPALKDNHFMRIKILDQKQLSFSHIDGVKFSEISDVAYNKKSKILYLISDEGRLFTFKATFSQKIEELKPLGAVRVTKRNGKKFKKWRRDTEGMALDEKGRLLISFEGKPRVALFDTKGHMIKRYTLPVSLRSKGSYRTPNKSLEALALHPKYGILTVAEWPLKKYHKKEQTIYALSGKRWHFKAEPEAKSAVSAIEVMDDGNILVLERSFTGLLNPFIVTLKKVYLDKCSKRVCKSEVLAKMNTHKGWSVDNFEGLAKVGNHRYIMVSDDNDNFFQRTLLIYFEVE
jgi:hypothetical protein